MRGAALARFAARDLRGGFSGLRIFIACLAIGVASIVGVNSVAQALQDGLAREGRRLAGGDASFSVIHRQLTPEERGFLAAHGALDDVASLRAMARNAGGDATLADVKAVSPSWPPVGQAVFAPPAAPADALAASDGAFGAEVDDTALDRLGLKIGDRFQLGAASLIVRGRVVSEPDSLASGIGFGAHMLISQQALAATGLVQPGSLVRYTTRVKMGETPPPEAAVKALLADAKRNFPQAGWEVRDRTNVSPEFSRNVDRFGEFLALVGLISLVVGGVGVANAARGFLDRKRTSLAILKALGATGAEIVLTAGMQFLVVAAFGVGIGIVAGAAMPYLVALIAGAALPYPFEPGLFPREWALGALYGGLAALAFSIAPLGRAHDLPATALFRDLVAGEAWPLRWRYPLAATLAAALLAGAAVYFSPQRSVALTVVVAVAVSLIALRGVASAGMALARALPRRGPVEWRLALSNLHRPGGATPAAVLSLGLGLAVLVALTLVDVNLRGQLASGRGRGAGLLFPRRARRSGRRLPHVSSGSQAPGVKIADAPLMRGRIVRVAGVDAEKVKASRRARNGRSKAIAASLIRRTLPKGAEDRRPARGGRPIILAPPLVSVEEDIAKGLGLKVGDDHHRQRAGPRSDGEGRQSAQGQLAQLRHQFRTGVLAQHVPRRAAHRVDDRRNCPRARGQPERSRAGARDRPRRFQMSRACGCARRSTPSRGWSAGSTRRFARRRWWRWPARCWCWRARCRRTPARALSTR